MAPSASESLRPTLFLQERGRIEGQDDPLVRGVVFDVPVDGGLDTLAGYADGTARYLNHSGHVIVWEVPDGNSPIRPLVERMVALAPPLLRDSTLLTYGESPAEPGGDPPQVTLLGPDGLHVRRLGDDEASGRLFGAATALMQALITTAMRKQ